MLIIEFQNIRLLYMLTAYLFWVNGLFYYQNLLIKIIDKYGIYPVSADYQTRIDEFFEAGI